MFLSNVRFWERLTAFVFIIALSLSIINCSPLPVRFTVELDESDFIDYGFGGGELGAEWTHIVIRGDGQVMYQYTFPYNGTWPQDNIDIEHQLSLPETKELFQSLVDNGLFDLSDVKSGGADVPATIITASFDEHSLKVYVEGTPDESIHRKISDIVSMIHPER
jgi:hypothetical protein